MSDERRPGEGAADEADKTGQVDNSVASPGDNSVYHLITSAVESNGNGPAHQPSVGPEAGTVVWSAQTRAAPGAKGTTDPSDGRGEPGDLDIQEAAKAEWLAGMPAPKSAAEQQAREEEWPRMWARRTGASMPPPPRLEEFAELLRVTGRGDDELISVCHDDGRFRSDCGSVSEAPAWAWRFRDRHCWFGTAPLHLRVYDRGGRGCESDVVGIRTMVADLDAKLEGLRTFELCQAVIDTLSGLLGTVPVAVVNSGHGLQPYWAVEQSEETDWPDETDPRFSDAMALSRRFGRLVAAVAHQHGGRVDTVSDPSRVLRVPGSVNVKDPQHPLSVTVEYPRGMPVSLAMVREICDGLAVAEEREDREPLGEQVSVAGDWSYAERSCRYMQRVVSGWATDTANGSRHNWLLGKMTRLAAAHRYGCLTQDDRQTAFEVLVRRFGELIQGTDRPPQPLEIGNAEAFGIRLVESFTDERTAAELGDPPHTHAGPDSPEAGRPFAYTAPGTGSDAPQGRGRRSCYHFQTVFGADMRAVSDLPPDERLRRTAVFLAASRRYGCLASGDHDSAIGQMTGLYRAAEWGGEEARQHAIDVLVIGAEDEVAGYSDQQTCDAVGGHPHGRSDGVRPSEALGGTAYRRSDLANLPPVEPLVAGVMSRRAAVLVVGPTTVGKTFFMLGIAASVAMGVRWLGQDVEACKVLYVVGEGAHGLDRRLAAWETSWRTPITDDRIEFRVKPTSLASGSTWAALTAHAVGSEVGLVVIDTFSSCAPDADETKDASRITRYLSDLAEAIDGTAVLVHHPGWGDTGRARGGSQLEANVDEVLVLADNSNDEDPVITLTRKKVKEGPDGSRHWLRLREAHGSAVFEMSSATDQAASLRARILQVFADYGRSGITGPQLAAELDMDDKRSAMHRELRLLRADGVVLAEGSRGHERYYLASDSGRSS